MVHYDAIESNTSPQNRHLVHLLGIEFVSFFDSWVFDCLFCYFCCVLAQIKKTRYGCVFYRGYYTVKCKYLKTN